MSSAAKQSVSRVPEGVLTDSIRRRSQERNKQAAEASDSRFANIQANTFHNIMFSPDSTPEQKRELVAAALTFSGTKEESRARIKEFDLFKEYLQSVREGMATEIIQLTNTENFSELQKVYKDWNDSLVDFNEKMKPLTDITDALYVLRAEGQTQNALQEILDDRKFEEEYRKSRTELTNNLGDIDNQIRKIHSDNAALSEQKTWFGMGNIKAEAREQLARNGVTLTELLAKRSDVYTEINALDNKQRERQAIVGKFAKEKARLRELLDLTSEGHVQRQTELVQSALHFVKTGKERTSSIREHLDKMVEQVEGLGDANTSMSQVYAIMNDAVKVAGTRNQEMRDGFLPKDGVEEDMITKMKREDTKQAVEEFITVLDDTAANTVKTYADLTKQNIRIRDMRESTRTQVDKARNMHSDGIAGVAEGLSVVLQAVSSAAINESSAMAKNTLETMARTTNLIAQKESIRIALGREEVNADLEKALEELAAYGEVQREATDISRSTISEMRERLQDLEQVAMEVGKDISERIAVNADAVLGAKKEVTVNTTTTKDPFAKFGV